MDVRWNHRDISQIGSSVFQLRSAPYTVLYAIQVSDLTNKNINALIGLWSNNLFRCSIVYVYYHSLLEHRTSVLLLQCA